MEQLITEEPKPKIETLYYPPKNYEINIENNYVEKDVFFIDKTIPSIIDERKSICGNGRINKINNNTFYLHNGCDFYGSFICFFVSFFPLSCFIYILIFGEFDLGAGICLLVFFAVFFSMGIYAGIMYNCKEIIKLNPNSIISIKRALFKCKTKVYNIEELERAEIYYIYVVDNTGDEVEKFYSFRLYFITKSGKKELFHKIKSTSQKEERLKGVKYFIDLINLHIQQNKK